MVRLHSFLLFSFFVFSTLSACGPIQRNNAIIPPMYAHHNKEHKTPEGRAPHKIGYNYTPFINDKSFEIWLNIASDLVDQLEEGFTIRQKALYLQPHPHVNMFVNSYDAALRQRFLERGFTLSETGDDVITLYYEAHPRDAAADEVFSERLTAIEFRITAAYNDKVIDMVSVNDFLPSFYRPARTSYKYQRMVNHLDLASKDDLLHSPWSVKTASVSAHEHPQTSSQTSPHKLQDKLHQLHSEIYTGSHPATQTPYPPAPYKKSTE